MVQLGVFAKYWQAGKVKTRLAASIGDKSAAELYRLFLETVLRRTEKTAADTFVLAFSPPDKENEFHELAGDRWTLEPQSDGELGERMTHYFKTAFANGAVKAVLIGSDSPDLPLSRLQDAFDALGKNASNDERKIADIVLGPSKDGGYYLVGMRDFVPQIFENIEWSTSDVLQQTLNAAKKNGKSVHLLDEWYDVDTVEDLDHLKAELSDSHFTSKSAEIRLLERINKV